MCTKTQFIYLIYSDPLLYKLTQSYFRIDHLLGRNLIENLTVLRFANLVFQPLWSRTYIRNVQVPFYNNINMFLMKYTEYSLNCEITYCRSFYQKTWPCRQEGNHKGCLQGITKKISFYILLDHLCRYFDGYGIVRDIVHSHILQTIALLAMEPPISLDGEDIRNEKVRMHVVDHFNASSYIGEKLLFRSRF